MVSVSKQFILLIVILSGLVNVWCGHKFSCGYTNYQGSRVISGVDAKNGAWPWQVLLSYNESPFCGGAIINPLWIVTASHCLIRSEPLEVKNLDVVVGATNFLQLEPSRNVYRIAKAIRHPVFSMSHLKNDIALLKLQKPLLFSNYIRPVCLPSLPPHTKSKCFVTGWGRKSRDYNSTMFPILQQAEMPIVNRNVCSIAMKRHATYNITSTSLCAGYGNATQSACHGDSGGPFVCYQNDRWELQGVVSWGSENCSELRDQYSIFANLFKLKDWVLKTISKN
ncbi:chymotrypsinogen B isoform X2 [Hydra vulgaris]|uniref:Chymotrypsinogen B isoform X2 n=1 Tax=Hydra vulgaris TaxID=6087 RepID=A0ABM4CJ13_HYDVU